MVCIADIFMFRIYIGDVEQSYVESVKGPF